MTELDFLSPDLARADGGFAPAYRSPLERALRAAPAHIRDVSRTGKLEVRGDIATLDAGEVVRITPTRALVLCDFDATAALRAALSERFEHVVDLSAALAGLAMTGERLLRRLTALDLDALPAAGAVARVPALVLRDGDDFRIFFAQEYADYVAHVVLDTAEGLR